MQNSKFVQAVINGGVDIIKELKRIRRCPSSMSSKIDGKVVAGDISNHFANIYKVTDNQVDNTCSMLDLCSKVQSSLGHNGYSTLDKIDDILISKAIKMMKPNKPDGIWTFNLIALKWST